MWYTIKRLSLGIALIACAAAALLVADWDRRVQDAPGRLPRIAVFKYASNPTQDIGVQGVLEGMAAAGYRPGEQFTLTRYNAENDLPTATMIAQKIVNDRYDMVITQSTLCLQAMANANRDGTVTHVFGLVTDPAGAGVGISRSDPLDHPAHLAGMGSFQPVEELFRLAHQLNPNLKRVGTVWNPSETCSTACVEKARAICRELGIELIEAAVDNSAGVLGAANSLASRGAELLWVGGDNTVESAIGSMAAASRRARVPLFTNNPGNIPDGATLALGADYRLVGQLTGKLAVEIIAGRSPASVPIEDVVPRRLGLNLQTAGSFGPAWSALVSYADTAAVLLRKNGTLSDDMAPASSAPLAKKWRVALIQFIESPGAEDAIVGLYRGLDESGLVAGRDYEISAYCAQGDMAALGSIFAAALNENPDIVLTLSTPTLQQALQRVKDIPVVFNYVADPIVAGAGTTFSDHASNVTGAFVRTDYPSIVGGTRQLLPDVHRIGTLHNPTEVNSVKRVVELEAEADRQGIEFVTVGVNTSSEVADGSLALCGQGVDAIVQIIDNLSDASFSAIGQIARKEKIPLVGFVSHNADEGAVLTFAQDFQTGGYVAAQIAARVMRGEDPSAIPIVPIDEYLLIVNLETAAELGLTVPPELLDRADKVIGGE